MISNVARVAQLDRGGETFDDHAQTEETGKSKND
jgi:hypothetical protein